MYSLRISATAEKQMRRLPVNVMQAINRRIKSLVVEPRPNGVKKLVGGLGWRVRVGDYRVIFKIDDEARTITIVAVKPRQSAYG